MSGNALILVVTFSLSCLLAGCSPCKVFCENEIDAAVEGPQSEQEIGDARAMCADAPDTQDCFECAAWTQENAAASLLLVTCDREPDSTECRYQCVSAGFQY